MDTYRLTITASWLDYVEPPHGGGSPYIDGRWDERTETRTFDAADNDEAQNIAQHLVEAFKKRLPDIGNEGPNCEAKIRSVVLQELKPTPIEWDWGKAQVKQRPYSF